MPIDPIHQNWDGSLQKNGGNHTPPKQRTGNATSNNFQIKTREMHKLAERLQNNLFSLYIKKIQQTFNAPVLSQTTLTEKLNTVYQNIQKIKKEFLLIIPDDNELYAEFYNEFSPYLKKIYDDFISIQQKMGIVDLETIKKELRITIEKKHTDISDSKSKEQNKTPNKMNLITALEHLFLIQLNHFSYLQDLFDQLKRNLPYQALFQSSDELRSALENFVIESIFPFFEQKNQVIEWFQQHNLDNNIDLVDKVYKNICVHTGIREISANINEKYNPELHYIASEHNNRKYTNNAIIKVIEKGYQIDWSNRIIRKAGIAINYI